MYGEPAYRCGLDLKHTAELPNDVTVRLPYTLGLTAVTFFEPSSKLFLLTLKIDIVQLTYCYV